MREYDAIKTTLKKLTPDVRAKILETCIDLRDYYYGEGVAEIKCLLCEGLPTCGECPWFVIEGIGCINWMRTVYGPQVYGEDFDVVNPFISDLREAREPQFCAARIWMLDRWIECLLTLREANRC